MTSTQGPSLFSKLLAATLIQHKSWVPEKAYILSLGLAVIKVVGCVFIDVINAHLLRPVVSLPYVLLLMYVCRCAHVYMYTYMYICTCILTHWSNLSPYMQYKRVHMKLVLHFIIRGMSY